MAPPKQSGKKRSHAVATLRDEDEAFPRGGADTLTPLERRQIEEEARLALEQEQAAASGKATEASKPQQKQGSAKAKRTKQADDDADASEHFLGDAGSKGSKYVHLLSAKRLSVGTRLLAMVLELSATGLTLSLPHGLRGHVSPEEVSDVLAQMLDPESKAGATLRAACDNGIPPGLPELFHVGQYVRCEVISLESKGGKGQQAGALAKRMISCSLRLKKLCAGRGSDVVVAGAALPAVVRSVEDHGFTLELGIKGVKGFLSRADYEAAHGAGVSVLPGMLLDTAVISAPDARGVAQLSADPTRIANALASDSDALGLSTLLPGMLINTKVTRVLQDGLHVRMLGVLTGSVDLYHLGPGLPTTKVFRQDQKLKARVLYVDPNAKEVALSLLPHIINLTMPAPIPMMGQVFDAAPVARVDEGLGLLLQLPLGGELGGSCPAFCHVSNVADEPLAGKLNTAFKAGTSTLKCRVIGFRLVDGLATVSARTAALEQQVMSYKDVVPGQVLTAKVVNTEMEAGLLLEVAPRITALVPVLHMSDLGKDAARKKFKVGQQVTGRVLNVDAAGKKMSMTLKPALLGSKLTPITTVMGLPVGLRSHGVITGIADHGVFVSFYGGVSGLAPLSELGLAKPSDKPASVFHVGQVVRARVIDVNAASQRVKLSLKSGGAATQATTIEKPTDVCGDLQPGDVVEGRVVSASKAAGGEEGKAQVLNVEVWRAGQPQPAAGQGVPARLELPNHLADHPAAVKALLPLMMQPGALIGQLVVLERMEGQKCVLVSRKHSLVMAAHAGRLPISFQQVREGSLVHGYVANVTNDAVFVRFAGHVTGRAGLSQLADTFVSDPQALFSAGQSVRAQVVTVDADKQRFSVTLRPSLTSSTDASYVASLYRDLELAARLTPEPAAEEWQHLEPGRVVSSSLHEVVKYGVLVDIDKHEDLVGIIPPHQWTQAQHPPVGSALACRVLEAGKLENVLYLTAKPALVQASSAVPSASAAAGKKKHNKAQHASEKLQEAGLKVGLKVDAVVEMITEAPTSTAVLSLPGYGHALAHAALTDFNAAVPQAVRRKLPVGSHVIVTVQVLPSADTGSRLLVALDLNASGASQAEGKAGKELTPGAVVTATVTAINTTFVEVTVGRKTAARIPMCEVRDLPDASQLLAAQQQGSSQAEEEPPRKKARKQQQQPSIAPDVKAWLQEGAALQGVAVGQEVQAVVLPRSKGRSHTHGHHGQWELSMRPSAVAAAQAKQAIPGSLTFSTLKVGALVSGCVLETGDDHIWVSITPSIRARIHILDGGPEPQALASFSAAHPVGSAIAGHIAQVDAFNHTVDLTLLPTSLSVAGQQHTVVSAAALAHAAGKGKGEKALSKVLKEGSLVMGKVVGLGGSAGGLKIHLGGKLYARVALTDIHDTWVPNALEGIKEGAYVRAAVVSVDAPEGDSGAGAARIMLSLRTSRGGRIAGTSKTKASKDSATGGSAVGSASKELLSAADGGSAPVLKVGATVRGYVKRSDAKMGVFVTLDRHRDARIKLRDLSDGFVEDPVASFPPGLLVEGRITACQGTGAQARIDMSLRTAAANGKANRSVSDFKEGQVVTGRVRRVEAYGVFVELDGSNVVGLAHISELSDERVKDINALFRVQQTVKAKVLTVDLEKGKISLSMKPSHFNDEEDEEGTAAQEKAVARDLDEEMADAEQSDEADDGDGKQPGSEEGSEDEESEGEGKGKANGVSIDDMDVDDDSDNDDLIGSQNESEEGEGEEDGEEEDDEEEGQAASDVEEEDEDGDELMDEDDEEDDQQAAGMAGAQLRQRLAATAQPAGPVTGDEWGGLLVVDDHKPADAGIPSDGHEKKASKATKKREREEAERKIREAELARLKGEAAPQSVVEFERSVLASPNSSYTWIRYMAWLLGLGETDKARAVAQRALDTIHYREEGEKFNVWVAWLNLEAAYGAPSPSDALMTLFNKAVQYCDAKKLYFALLGILTRHGHAELEEATLKTMCRRFNGSAKVWLRALESQLSAGDGEGARKLLERALQALPKRKHIKAITGCALLEFRLGSAERGRGVMEGVLRNYPKRLDLWSVYIDQEVKLGDEQRTRALFERATSLQLPPRKIKFLFKRWLEWEKSVSGGAATAAVEHVKQRAMEFVQNSMKA